MDTSSLGFFVFSILLFGLSGVQSEIPINDGPHPCERTCGGPPMECHYEMIIEWFMTLSKACYNCPFNLEDCYRPHCIPGNGNRRLVASINRQIPGPTLTVCEGDTIIANVTNEMENGVTVSMHWHGMPQAGTQYMDGVPYVTQCPIIYRNFFVYKFTATPSGTYFYHSHEALMLGDGIFGTLVIKDAPNLNPHYDLYSHDCETPDGDCEQLLFLMDWAGNNDWIDFMRDKFYSNHRSWSGIDERVMMINGQNRMYEVTNIDSNGATALTPHHIFHVKPGKRYRFRTVASTTNACRYMVDISHHRLKAVASDGMDFKAVDVDNIGLFGGERWDFIVEFNQPIANYWLRLRNIGPCRRDAAAVIHYEGAPDPIDLTWNEEEFVGPEKPVYLNPPLSSDTDKSPKHNNWPYEDGILHVGDLESVHPLPDTWKKPADKVFYLAFDVEFHGEHYNHPIYYPGAKMPDLLHPGQAVFNNISMKLPVAPPLSQPEMDVHNWYCNDSIIEQCREHLCHCTHYLKADLGDVVDLVHINEAYNSGWTGHPNHLHGYHFRVMAYGKVGDQLPKHEAIKMYESGAMNLNYDGAPILKDTVQIAGGGYTVMRFLADNPGIWIVHCHILFHAMEGMDLIIQVGEREDFPPVPKGFPKCGPFVHEEAVGDYLGEENMVKQEQKRDTYDEEIQYEPNYDEGYEPVRDGFHGHGYNHGYQRGYRNNHAYWSNKDDNGRCLCSGAGAIAISLSVLALAMVVFLFH